MAMWDDIVKAASKKANSGDDEEECDRCGGKGKVVLFSSVENPCKKCGGAGVFSSSSGGKGNNSKKKASVSSDKLMQNFFAHVCGHQLPSNDFDGQDLNNPLTDKHVQTLIKDFETECNNRLRGVPTTLSFLQSTPKPTLAFCRPKGFSTTILLSSGYKTKTCWNSSKAWDLPKNTIVVYIAGAFTYARYYRW